MKHRLRNPMTIEEANRRFWTRVNKTDSCWLWTAATNGVGYGMCCLPLSKMLAHRRAYELCVGPIPEGLVLDHLCRNPGCVNPEHLQPVTQKENSLRGISPMAQNASKLYCRRGHKFSGSNLRIDPKSGSRKCKACDAENARRYRKAHAVGLAVTLAATGR